MAVKGRSKPRPTPRMGIDYDTAWLGVIERNDWTRWSDAASPEVRALAKQIAARGCVG